MLRSGISVVLAVLFFPVALSGQDQVASALSAAPSSLGEHATVVDWEGNELRAGSNGWTCLPDVPDTPGDDPMCLDANWMAWADAYMNQTEPEFDGLGIGYMVRGSSPGSNVDPYASGPTDDNEWMDESVPHLMLIVPDASLLEGMSTDPDNGGPWVMWKGTPYEHVMVPVPPTERWW